VARSILVVRLGALGDLVHALPAVAAMRASWPDAVIDWLVDARYAALLEFVPVIDRAIVVGGRSGRSIADVVATLRRARYDVAIDFQGLIKSAAFARLARARETAGFASAQLREPLAALFYTRRITGDDGGHVVRKNLSLVESLGAGPAAPSCPLNVPQSTVVEDARRALGVAPTAPFAIVNPGAGWPNKQWPPDRFGALASHLRDRHGLASLVVWGPGDRALAGRVEAASAGAAGIAPPTSLAELIELARAATLFVAGDTGPMQLAAAAGTPIVGVFGPTNPGRNGPWDPADVCVSRFDDCECHHKRRCRRPSPCIDSITVEEVARAVDRRLSPGGARG
jgi:heptosyltransferase I